MCTYTDPREPPCEDRTSKRCLSCPRARWNMSWPECQAPWPEGDGASSGTGTEKRIKFNNSIYASWSHARDAFHRLKNRSGSKWAKIIAVDQPNGSFKLRCRCGANCQLANPSQFFKTHRCSQIQASTSKSAVKGVCALVPCVCSHRGYEVHTNRLWENR